MLVAGAEGKSRRDFTGKLSFAWPSACEPGTTDLLPRGFGGSYAAAPQLPVLKTDCSLAATDPEGGLTLFDKGLKPGIAAWSSDNGLANLIGTGPGFKVTAFDANAQEDARRVTFNTGAAMRFMFDEQAFPAGAGLEMTFRVNARPTAPVTLTAIGTGANAGTDLAPSLALAEGKDWRTLQVPLACLADGAVKGISLASAAAFVFDVQSIRIVPQTTDTSCTGPF